MMTTTHEPGPRPRLMTRLATALRREIGADTIDALRRAGRGVYEDVLLVASLREQLAMPGGARSQPLCTWNA